MLIKSLFTVLSLTLALGLSSITTSVIAAPPAKSPSSTTLDDYKKPPSFLFVVQAKEAVMKPVKDDKYRYTLTMKLNDDNLSKIIQFSDRPYRIVEMVTAKQLNEMWGEGTNSFKTDPPNAVLSANGFDARIVIIESQTIDNGVMTFTLRSAPKQGGRTDGLVDAVLTIDELGCIFNGVVCIG